MEGLRRYSHLRRCALLAAMVLGTLSVAPAHGEELTFEQHVRPIFKAYCFECHGGHEEIEGSLDLRLKRFVEKGGDSGPSLVPGKAAESLLVARLKAGEMPPGEGKVPADKIALIERWINQGAKTLRDEPEKLAPGIDITPEERAFWSFQPLKETPPPQFTEADRARTPIDAYILARLREKGLSFAPDADKRTLLTRASLDLTGLPPSADEMQAFLADNDPAAYDRALDRLLESPHYGERWGRHWLDVAGYADSEGDGNTDTVRPYAYKYRDYVIRSLNADKPFDQFLLEQLAGDELVPQPWKNLTPEQIEKLTATGYLRMAVDGTQSAGNLPEAANLVVADTLKIVSTSLLGLTVGCAECHDHRYDPIPHVDYYRMRAIFEPALNVANWRRPTQRRVSLYTDEDRAKAASIEAEAVKMQEALNEKTKKFLDEAFDKELAKFPANLQPALREAYTTPANKRTEEQKQLLAKNPSANITAGVLYQYNQAAADELKKDAEKIAAKRAEKPVEDFLRVLSEVPGQIPATHLFHRGDYRQPKQEVLPGDLTIAAPEGHRLELPKDDPSLPTTGRRTAYAKHLTSGQHPLVGRVLANRIWMHHFGRGLVDTPADFGLLGNPPSHPKLLDYLALELPRQGWSLKRLHKLIMRSTVYRQSSQRSPAQEAVDNENRLLGHFPLQRLDAEIIRDRMLVAAGKLDRTQFGPAIPVEEDFVGQVLPAGKSTRRSVYLQVRRSKPVSMLVAFDAPVMSVNCERRVPSTTAPQSLVLMNSDFVLTQAGAMAGRLRGETPPDYARELAAPLAAKYQRPADAWQFGYGAYDPASQRIEFSPLPHWTGSAWQGGPALPDPSVGWAIVHAAGGHAGNDPQHASIRRWTAPQKGVVTIHGKLKHGSENGDGVRGRIVSSRSGEAGEWRAKAGETATDVAKLAVEPGDTLDFAVDCVDNVNSDSYSWSIDLTLAAEDGQMLGAWNAASDFHGPNAASLPQMVARAWQIAYQRPPAADELAAACDFVAQQIDTLRKGKAPGDHELAALTSLCQQLLSSNEFLYVD